MNKKKEDGRTETSISNPTAKELEEALKRQDEKDKRAGLTTKLSREISEAKRPENFFVVAIAISMFIAGIFSGMFVLSYNVERAIVSLLFFVVALAFYIYRYKPRLGNSLAGMTMIKRG